MTFEEAEDAYINHKRVYRSVTDYDKELYIEAITGTLCCSVKGNDEIRYYANLSNGTQVSIDRLSTICPGQLEYENKTEYPTIHTKRGDFRDPVKIQNCIDTYEQRIHELTGQVNTLYAAFKDYRVIVAGNAEIDEERWKKLNTIAKKAEDTISGYPEFNKPTIDKEQTKHDSPTPSKEKLTLNAEQIERCKKIFEDDRIGINAFMKKMRDTLNKTLAKEEPAEPKFHKGDYVMGEHNTPEGEKAVYIGIIDQVHTDNVFFEAIYIIPFNGNKSQLLIGCKAYKNNTILFNNKHKTVITGPHGVYIDRPRLTTMKAATRDKITQLDHNLSMFGFKYEDFEMLNNQWEGVNIHHS